MDNEKDQDLTTEELNKTNISTDAEINTFMDINTPDQKISQELIGFFSFKGRSGRFEFFKIQSMIFLFIIINAIYFLPIASEEYITGFLITSWLMTFATIPLTVKRLHDSNITGWFYLINLIPNILLKVGYLFFDFLSAGVGIYFLYLVLRAGDPNPNDYGIPNPPKKYGNTTINLICIFIFILIVISGILATNS